jgi:DNA topoisomerase I
MLNSKKSYSTHLKEIKMKLIIVESPVKVRTINKYLKQLGILDDYFVFATAGHILDLDPKKYSVHKNEDGSFTGDVIPIHGKGKIISELKRLVSKATEIYMCQDDDREGERISYDIVDVCSIKKYYRVVLLSITMNEIKRAFEEKVGVRLIDEKIVTAQKARRLIDRVIGYGLSPAIAYYFSKNKILSYKHKDEEITVKPNGTGRVIGISLGILAKRQEDIEKYKEQGEYITDVVVARYSYNGVSFDAKGTKLEYLKKDSDQLSRTLTEANNKLHRVYDYKPDTKEIPPYPAFTTSTLYSACSYLHDLPPHETKKITQDLFETGYITYPRTDSPELCNEASEAIITFLIGSFDETEYGDILKVKRKYKRKKSAFAQEAHEGIRPLYFSDAYEPNQIKHIWDNDKNCTEFNNYHKFVYELIWYRAISTQLVDSVYDISKITISAGEYTFVANARNRITDGWERYYGDILHASDKGKGDEDWITDRVVLPTDVYVGLVLEDRSVESYEKHSRSPKRISEGGLITQLVTNGVARPSTLHTISQSLKKKKYIVSNKTLLTPTDLGMAVYSVTENYLSWINNIKDAQNFEKVIEEIEAGGITDVDEVINIYWEKVEEFKSDINYVSLENREPTKDQIDFAEKMIKQMSEADLAEVNRDLIFSSQKEMSAFLNTEANKHKKELSERVIGVCPKCDKKSIISDEKLFRCYNRQCDFIVWNNSVDGFIERFQAKVERVELITKLLNEPIVELPLIGSKSNEPFDGKLNLSFNKDYKSWGVSFM